MRLTIRKKYGRRSRRESITLEERAQEEREQERENDVNKPSGREYKRLKLMRS